MSGTEEKNELWIAERRAYYYEWREKNKERIKEYNRRYWEKRANKTQQKGRYQNNADFH